MRHPAYPFILFTPLHLCVLFLILNIITVAAYAKDKPHYGNTVAIAVKRIVDGDTFRVNIPNYPAIIGYDIPVRIDGIDAPEIRRAKCPQEKELGIKAMDKLAELLSKGRHIWLVHMRRDSFFRIRATVFMDTTNVGAELIKKGLAVPESKKDFDWCSYTLEDSENNQSSRPIHHDDVMRI